MNNYFAGIKQRTVLILIAIWFVGCATILTGTTDTLKFDANIPGVKLSIDGMKKGSLPLTVTMSRNFMNGESFKAKFEAPGYETQEFVLKREFNAVAVLDVTSIVTSGGVDLLTGALMKFSPTDYHIQMEKIGTNTSSFESERSKKLYRFVLSNFNNLQRDLSVGGGEHLTSFVAAIIDNRSTVHSGENKIEVSTLITQQALNQPAEIISAMSPHDFVRHFNAILASQENLQQYQM